jgi:hypothetical protein
MRKIALAGLLLCLVVRTETLASVTSSAEHTHGFGSCFGEIMVSESALTYAATKGPSARFHSFSVPLRNVRTYKFLDNSTGKDARRPKGMLLELIDWSAADGAKGNLSTLIFQDRKAFAGARRLMDAAHTQK